MAQWIAAATSLIVAAAAVLLTYQANRRLSRQRDRLVRINAQLEEFYGPLLALASMNDAAWRVLMGAYRSGGRPFFDGSELNESDRKLWIEWMQTVFMPANRRMFEIIVTKGHLLAGDGGMPQSLLDFCAHVAGYEVVLQRWEMGDYSTLTSLIEYPSDSFLKYIRDSYLSLRQRQIKLLALTGRG